MPGRPLRVGLTRRHCGSCTDTGGRYYERVIELLVRPVSTDQRALASHPVRTQRASGDRTTSRVRRRPALVDPVRAFEHGVSHGEAERCVLGLINVGGAAGVCYHAEPEHVVVSHTEIGTHPSHHPHRAVVKTAVGDRLIQQLMTDEVIRRGHTRLSGPVVRHSETRRGSDTEGPAQRADSRD